MDKWSNLSNSDILKEQKKLSDRYDELKNELILEQEKLKNIQDRVENSIKEGIRKLKELDVEYNKSNEILKNRKYGR